jgi:hypothetical protein
MKLLYDRLWKAEGRVELSDNAIPKLSSRFLVILVASIASSFQKVTKSRNFKKLPSNFVLSLREQWMGCPLRDSKPF